MNIPAEKLIDDLKEQTQLCLEEANKWTSLEDEQLNWRPAPKKWSILECLEHLNLYGDFYLPEIAKRINASRHPAESQYKSGILGNYFANSLRPSDKPQNMKTFKEMNTFGRKLEKQTIARFIMQQHQMLALLEECRNVSLNKTKTSISISNIIKLKLGDTLRVVIYHNHRHILQAKRVLEAQEISEQVAMD